MIDFKDTEGHKNDIVLPPGVADPRKKEKDSEVCSSCGNKDFNQALSGKQYCKKCGHDREVDDG